MLLPNNLKRELENCEDLDYKLIQKMSSKRLIQSNQLFLQKRILRKENVVKIVLPGHYDVWLKERMVSNVPVGKKMDVNIVHRQRFASWSNLQNNVSFKHKSLVRILVV